MTLYPRGLAFVAIALLIMLVIDWLGIDWRVGLVAVSLDAVLTLLAVCRVRGLATRRTP